MIKVIKENIKREIKKHGTTTGEVCDNMRKDRNYIYRLTDEVKAAKIISIACAIGCEPYELFKGL